MQLFIEYGQTLGNLTFVIHIKFMDFKTHNEPYSEQKQTQLMRMYCKYEDKHI